MGTLLLVNTNRMMPPIAPVGLDYLACSCRAAGIPTDVLDLGLAEDPWAALEGCLSQQGPALIGLSFRNVDDCFWPGKGSFVPELARTVERIRKLSAAPVVLGGVGYSIFPERLLEETGADFGIRGDGEGALASLFGELEGGRSFTRVSGLLWRAADGLRSNPPSWPLDIDLAPSRDSVDNATYFRKGGQLGVETKRGCPRGCIYCADPLAKGTAARLRAPYRVAAEMEALLRLGIDVFHLCDSEFNIPRDHAVAVCEEIVRRGLGEKIRWYAYLAVVPFDEELAALMRRAGCLGINFTGDAGSQAMLSTYRHAHRREDIREAIRLCRSSGIRVMIDLLLGGPGETPATLKETVDFLKDAGPDGAGAALGIRVYPGTEMERRVLAEGPAASNPSIRRAYEGPVDFLEPTFYVARELGEKPAALVRDLIAGDRRFFEPMPDPSDRGDPAAAADPSHNYNFNVPLLEAIEKGARGAYWDILLELRGL